MATSPLPLLIGLTGGVAAGKSTVANLLEDRGMTVLNLDKIGHELMERDPRVAAELKKICGDSIIEGGAVVRSKVREILFASDEKKRAIEAYLHPLIWTIFLDRAKQAQAQGKKAVICEAALLIEGGVERQMTDLVVVVATENVRKQRLISRDLISPFLAAQMIQSQVDDSTRRDHATVLIENNGSLKDLQEQVDALYDRWKEKGWI
jgi:dephospho-CoA kinase